MFKKKSVIYLMILALVVLVVLISCEPRKGTLNANLQPYISITDYFGVDSDTLITESQLFQQTVQWSGTDEDGVVAGYAFRVLNEEGVPVATPGYDAITSGYDDPDMNGWVKFYLPNADTSIPLDQSAQTTIWFDQSYATINFPAADANGDSSNVVSIFEVKCKDNAESESESASKYFQAHSNTPTAMISSNIDGEIISTAIILEFAMSDEDPFVGDDAYFYEYKLEIRDSNNVVIPDSGYNDEWLSTLGSDDVTLALHSSLNNNPLIPNDLDNTTFLRVRAIDTALIESDEIEISFTVKEGFYPGTVIYFGEGNASANGIYALGTDHFATYLDEAISDILPSVQTSDGAHHATAFWYNLEQKYTAIGSNNFKTYMRWGYNGEFENNDPHKKRNDETKDELTGQTYHCQIIGYDIRLDGEPYYYPPIPAEGVHLQVDDDGKRWLRVGVNYPIGQATTLTLTSFGGSLDDMYDDHIFEVRAIDLQGAVDLTPHEFHFTIVPPISKEEKYGVLIIDDESNSSSSAPDSLLNDFYEYIVSDFETDPGYINREYMNLLLNADGLGDLHHGKSVIASSDIQQYKAIIYHADNPTAEFSFWKEFEVLKIYLLQGGNLIISSGSTLKIIHQRCSENAFNILEEYFGIQMSDTDAIGRASTSYTSNPFFIKAVAEDGYNDFDLLLPSFNTTITNPQAPILNVNGLGPVAYFNDGCEAEVIYRYGCKEVGEDPPGLPPTWHIVPTQEEYDEFNGLPVALKKVSDNNSCFIFGFPLSYMEPDQVKTMMTQLLNDLP
jgi:hypothetical protein